MASSAKGKGSVRTLQWWKHLRDWKRPQNKLVRNDGKRQINEEKSFTTKTKATIMSNECRTTRPTSRIGES